MSTVCRRCVQFRRECVQFSSECVHFSGKCVQSAFECVQSRLTMPPSRQPQRGGSWAVLAWRSGGVSARRRSVMALASGGDARARGVHRVGVEVFSFCPNVFTLRAKVFSFRRFPPRMCSLSRPMCSVGAVSAWRSGGVTVRRRSGIALAWGNTESLQAKVIRHASRDSASPSHPNAVTDDRLSIPKAGGIAWRHRQS